MNLSAVFIERPVATTLLTIGLAVAGAIAFQLLPVAPLPQVEFPTISVSGALPGARLAHLVVDEARSLHCGDASVLDTAANVLRTEFGLTHSTLQVEHDDHAAHEHTC